MQIIDADGHVAEGPSLAVEAMRRWPEHITPRADGRALVIEGRNYPEADGPGAGCPREHGLSTADGIDYSSAEGVLGDADRDQIDTMVLYPSLGLCAPTLEDPEFAAGFARLYNQWIADYCASSNGRLRGIAVTPIEHGEVAIDVMREAKDLGLVATHIPPALKTRNLDHPDLDRFYAAAVELDMPLGIHGAPGMHLPKVGVDRFTNYIQVHCISFPFPFTGGFLAPAMMEIPTGGGITVDIRAHLGEVQENESEAYRPFVVDSFTQVHDTMFSISVEEGPRAVRVESTSDLHLGDRRRARTQPRDGRERDSAGLAPLGDQRGAAPLADLRVDVALAPHFSAPWTARSGSIPAVGRSSSRISSSRSIATGSSTSSSGVRPS